MSAYEILTLIVALLAVAVSVISLVRSRAVEQEQLELQRTTSALARKQLEMLLAEESSEDSARISIQLERRGNGHRFVVRNFGDVPARNVSFTLAPHGKGDSPLVESDYRAKFPAPILQPGTSIGVLAAVSFGSATAFDVVLRWEDPSGRVHEEPTFVAL